MITHSTASVVLLLAHAAFVVVVAKFADEFEFIIGGPDANGRVRYTIEHGGFYHGVMNHILKHDTIANGQFLLKRPVAIIVA